MSSAALLAVVLVFAVPSMSSAGSGSGFVPGRDASSGGSTSTTTQHNLDLNSVSTNTVTSLVPQNLGNLNQTLTGIQGQVQGVVNNLGTTLSGVESTLLNLVNGLLPHDPGYIPPLHGQNPHGQGTIAVVQLAPTDTRPLSGNPSGAGDVSANRESVILGRSRGDFCSLNSWCELLDPTQLNKYHGHITVLSLFGNEIVSVDTNEGQSHNGPLDSLQTNLLDNICHGTNAICLDAVTADSTTCGPTSPSGAGDPCDPANLNKFYGVAPGQTVVGSFNHMAVANAVIGMPLPCAVGIGGLQVNPCQVVRIGCPSGAPLAACAANSYGYLYQSDNTPASRFGSFLPAPDTSGQCRTAFGKSSVADVEGGGASIALLTAAETAVTACNPGTTAPPNVDSSTVLNLGGGPLPLPIINPAGCSGTPNPTNPSGTGTPNTNAGLPVLAPFICNADDPGTGCPPPSGSGSCVPQAPIPYAVREALNICLLDATGPCVGQYVAKITLGAAEAASTAPTTGVTTSAPTTTTGPPTTTGAPPAVTPPSGKVTPPSKVTPPVTPPQEVVPAKEVTPSLPFTGYDAATAVLLGLMVLGSGLMLRGIVRRRSGAGA